jgi:hypothetical protein
MIKTFIVFEQAFILDFSSFVDVVQRPISPFEAKI